MSVIQPTLTPDVGKADVTSRPLIGEVSGMHRSLSVTEVVIRPVIVVLRPGKSPQPCQSLGRHLGSKIKILPSQNFRSNISLDKQFFLAISKLQHAISSCGELADVSSTLIVTGTSQVLLPARQNFYERSITTFS